MLPPGGDQVVLGFDGRHRRGQHRNERVADARRAVARPEERRRRGREHLADDRVLHRQHARRRRDGTDLLQLLGIEEPRPRDHVVVVHRARGPERLVVLGSRAREGRAVVAQVPLEVVGHRGAGLQLDELPLLGVPAAHVAGRAPLFDLAILALERLVLAVERRLERALEAAGLDLPRLVGFGLGAVVGPHLHGAVAQLGPETDQLRVDVVGFDLQGLTSQHHRVLMRRATKPRNSLRSADCGWCSNPWQVLHSTSTPVKPGIAGPPAATGTLWCTSRP